MLTRPSELEVIISDVSVETNNQCTPNQFFGDEIRLAIHTAKTAAVSPVGDYYNINNPDPLSTFRHAFIGPGDLDDPNARGVLPGACGNGECRFTLSDPEPGISRISLNGATGNNCRMSARVEISDTPRAALGLTASGSTADNCPLFPPNSGFSCALVFMPAGVSSAEFRLGWNGDWAHYPTNDLDLFLASPTNVSYSSAFRDSPEVVQILSPQTEEGPWFIVIGGFEVNTSTDTWQLQVTADGVVLPNGL